MYGKKILFTFMILMYEDPGPKIATIVSIILGIFQAGITVDI